MFSKSYTLKNHFKQHEKIKLVYFNTRGRAELIRFILHTAGATFVDERLEVDDWSKRKNEAPFGTLPYLEIDGQKYGESIPIARFLAKKYNLMGKTDSEEQNADAYLSLVHDVKGHLARFILDKILTDEQKAALHTKIEVEVLPDFCSKMELVLKASKSGFIVGNSVTIADLALQDLGDHLLKHFPEVFEQCPTICDHRQKIASLPKLNEYLTKRPESDQ